jgi:hypothetical protein
VIRRKEKAMNDLNPIERFILRREAMQFLKKYWPTITAVLGAAVPFIMPSLLVYVQAHPHTTVGVLLAAVIAAYHTTAPKDQGQDNSPVAKQSVMKVIALGLLFLALAPRSQAQTPLANLYGGGVSYNNAGNPSVAGTALWAHLVADGSKTYAFGVLDALPTSVKPFTVTTNISGGIAQKVFTLGKIDFYVPTSAGVSFQGSNTGWAWTAGGMAVFKIKGNFYAMPAVRVAKSSVSNGTGYQLIPGFYLGWGK